MSCERGRLRRADAIAALLVVAGTACAGGLEDPQRFEQAAPASSSTNAPSGALDDPTQMLPLLDLSTPVDPLLPTVPLAADAGSTVPSSGPLAPNTPPAPPACVVSVFESRCAGLECHGPGAPEVDLISPGVSARLVDQPSSPSLFCANRTFVATDGSSSLLLDKLRDAPPCGSRMPLKGNLGAQQVECLVQWVASLQQLPADADAGTP